MFTDLIGRIMVKMKMCILVDKSILDLFYSIDISPGSGPSSNLNGLNLPTCLAKSLDPKWFKNRLLEQTFTENQSKFNKKNPIFGKQVFFMLFYYRCL